MSLHPSERGTWEETQAHQLAQEVYWYVFHLLDAEPDLDGMEAGRVATVAEQAVYQALLSRAR